MRSVFVVGECSLSIFAEYCSEVCVGVLDFFLLNCDARGFRYVCSGHIIFVMQGFNVDVKMYLQLQYTLMYCFESALCRYCVSEYLSFVSLDDSLQ